MRPIGSAKENLLTPFYITVSNRLYDNKVTFFVIYVKKWGRKINPTKVGLYTGPFFGILIKIHTSENNRIVERKMNFAKFGLHQFILFLWRKIY